MIHRDRSIKVFTVASHSILSGSTTSGARQYSRSQVNHRQSGHFPPACAQAIDLPEPEQPMTMTRCMIVCRNGHCLPQLGFTSE